MERQFRYIVLKNKDIERHLDSTEVATLSALSDKVTLGRYNEGRAALVCVVVERDWPEYEATWAAIEQRVDGFTSGGSPLDVVDKKCRDWAQSGWLVAGGSVGCVRQAYREGYKQALRDAESQRLAELVDGIAPTVPGARY